MELEVNNVQISTGALETFSVEDAFLLCTPKHM